LKILSAFHGRLKMGAAAISAGQNQQGRDCASSSDKNYTRMRLHNCRRSSLKHQTNEAKTIEIIVHVETQQYLHQAQQHQ
jgi:hypothetical protein